MTAVPEMLRGFDEPVADAGRMFRVVLDAMSHPGRVGKSNELSEHPSDISDATAAVLLTLCDYATPVWVQPEIRSVETEKYIRFHSGAPLVDASEQAAFAVISGKLEMLQLDRFFVGTPEYPDRGATVIIDVDAFGAGDALRLSGPGIDGVSELTVAGAPAGLWDVLAENREQFPLGIDVILCAPGALVALPRTTMIEVA